MKNKYIFNCLQDVHQIINNIKVNKECKITQNTFTKYVYSKLEYTFALLFNKEERNINNQQQKSWKTISFVTKMLSKFPFTEVMNRELCCMKNTN
jgi:hypothetical protein